MNIKAFLFDFDGVLVDTEHYYTEFWAEQGRIYFPQIKDFSQIIKGRSLKTIYDEYFSNNPQAQVAIGQALLEQEKSMVYNYIPGAKEFLARTGESFKRALVTSSSERKMNNVYQRMPGIESSFDVIVTAADINKSKPNPECYLKAAERLGVSTGECLVFEDSLAGVEAGKAAGMKVVGLTTTEKREIIERKTDVVIDDFENFTPESLLQCLKSKK